jgi:hypothetical protein
MGASLALRIGPTESATSAQDLATLLNCIIRYESPDLAL